MSFYSKIRIDSVGSNTYCENVFTAKEGSVFDLGKVIQMINFIFLYIFQLVLTTFSEFDFTLIAVYKQFHRSSHYESQYQWEIRHDRVS